MRFTNEVMRVVVHVEPRVDPGVVITTMPGWIPSDELLRMNNEAHGLILDPDREELNQWPPSKYQLPNGIKVIKAPW